MGNWNSNALIPQHHLSPVVNARFVRRRRVTLVLHDQFWAHTLERPLELRDLHTHIVMFGVDTNTTQSRRLLDTYNYPVVSLDAPASRVLNSANAVNYTVSSIATRTLTTPGVCTCVGRIQVTPFGPKPELARVELSAPGSQDDAVVITCEGDWPTRRLQFFVQHANQHRECIAQVDRPSNLVDGFRIPNDCYLLDIAPGVDVALLLLMCAAMEEEHGRYYVPAPSSQPVAKTTTTTTTDASSSPVARLSKYCSNAGSMLLARTGKQNSNRVAVPA